MRVINRTASVPFSAMQMYNLVNDLESYPEYLPACQSTMVHSRTPEEVRSTVQLAKGGIKHSFTTINKLHPYKSIEIELLEGPFRHFKGLWTFEPEKNGSCKIHFHLEFLFTNRIIDLAVGPVLENIANQFVEAFCQRAYVVYNPSFKST